MPTFHQKEKQGKALLSTHQLSTGSLFLKASHFLRYSPEQITFEACFNAVD